MKEMIIAFSLTTAAIAGAVLYYRRKNKELKELFDIEMTQEKMKSFYLQPKGERKVDLCAEEHKIALERKLIRGTRDEREIKRELGIKDEDPEPSSPTEGFQGLPGKAPIDIDEKGWNVDVADRKCVDEFANKAEKLIQNHKTKKYSVNRRRKKRSAK